MFIKQMNKKILIQLSLLILAIILSTLMYKNFFSEKKIEREKKLNINKDKLIQNNSSSIIKNLEYVSYNSIGNKYKIYAKTSEIKNEDPDIVNMKDITSTIIISPSEIIIIKSKYAKYNALNYDTHFYGDVKVNYFDHKIICENLNLFFEKNLAIFSDKVIYTSLQAKLEADRLEIDLLTKNSKIFMDDFSKKIKALIIN